MTPIARRVERLARAAPAPDPFRDMSDADLRAVVIAALGEGGTPADRAALDRAGERIAAGTADWPEVPAHHLGDLGVFGGLLRDELLAIGRAA